MSGAWLRFRDTKCDNCGWTGRLEWHAPCPACNAHDNDLGRTVPTENERQMAVYLEEIGQGHLAGGRAWFDDPTALRIIPRRPAKTAKATARRVEQRRANLEEVRRLAAEGKSIAKIAAETGLSTRRVSQLKKEIRENTL